MKTLEGKFEQANNLRNNARVEEAIEEYLEIARQAGEEGQPKLSGQAMQLAGVSARQVARRNDSSKFRDSLKYFHAAELLYNQEGSAVDLGDLYRDIAIAYDYAGLGSQALPYFQKSIELLEKAEANSSLALTYDKLGLHFFRKDDLTAALDYVNRAIELAKYDRGHGSYRATIMLDLARILAKKGEFLEAVDWANQSLSWYEADHGQEQYHRRQAELHGLLSVVYDQLGETKKARQAAKKFEQLMKGFDIEAGQALRHDLDDILR